MILVIGMTVSRRQVLKREHFTYTRVQDVLYGSGPYFPQPSIGLSDQNRANARETTRRQHAMKLPYRRAEREQNKSMTLPVISIPIAVLRR